jgi:hypothetical protein
MSTSPEDNLEGQRALVTDATSGIGRALALHPAGDGAEVLIHGRNAAWSAGTDKEIEAAAGKASFVAAGISALGPTAEFDPAVFDKMFASNVRAPFFLVAALAPGMAARGHGSIVRARLHPDTLGPRVHLGARRDHAEAPRLTARGDRRTDRVPRLPTSEPHHRPHRRRRRRTQSDLARTKPATQSQQRSQP